MCLWQHCHCNTHCHHGGSGCPVPLPHICPSVPISGSVPPASLALAFSHLALHQPPSSPPASTPCPPLCLWGNQCELAACKSGDVTALPNSAKASHFSLNKRKTGNSVCMVCRHFSTPFPTSLHAMQGFVCKPPTTSGSEASSNILPCFRAAVLAGPLISSHISKGIQSFHPPGFSLNLTYSERPFRPTPAREPCSLSQPGSLHSAYHLLFAFSTGASVLCPVNSLTAVLSLTRLSLVPSTVPHNQGLSQNLLNDWPRNKWEPTIWLEPPMPIFLLLSLYSKMKTIKIFLILYFNGFFDICL